MSSWYNKIADTGNLDLLIDAIAYFENELLKASFEVKLKGSVERASSELPGIVEDRFRQYQEVEAILRYLEIQQTKVKQEVFKNYLENYKRALTPRDADKYADGDEAVIEYSLLINRFALVRNQYQGIMKALDVKHWQINNLVKLKSAGLEDYEV